MKSIEFLSDPISAKTFRDNLKVIFQTRGIPRNIESTEIIATELYGGIQINFISHIDAFFEFRIENYDQYNHIYMSLPQNIDEAVEKVVYWCYTESISEQEFDDRLFYYYDLNPDWGVDIVNMAFDQKKVNNPHAESAMYEILKEELGSDYEEKLDGLLWQGKEGESDIKLSLNGLKYKYTIIYKEQNFGTKWINSQNKNRYADYTPGPGLLTFRDGSKIIVALSNNSDDDGFLIDEVK